MFRKRKPFKVGTTWGWVIKLHIYDIIFGWATFNSLNIKKTHYRDITQQATSHFAGSEGDIDGPYFCVGVRWGSDRAQFCTELHLRQWWGEGWVTVTSLCRLPLNAFSSDRFKAEDGHTSSIRHTRTQTRKSVLIKEKEMFILFTARGKIGPSECEAQEVIVRPALRKSTCLALL